MEPKEKKYCIYCGEKISADAEQCEHCGEWFESSSISRNHVMNSYVPNEPIEEEDVNSINNESVGDIPVVIANDNNTNDINTVINSLKGNNTENQPNDNNLNKDNNIGNDNFKNSHNFNNLNNKVNVSNFSNILPIRRLFLLTLVTGGLYLFYWVYKNNCYLRDDLGKEVNPLLRAILLIVPLLNIFIVYDLLFHMSNHIKAEGIDSYSPALNILVWIFIPFGSAWALINVQESINELWRVKQPNIPIRREFTNPEIIVIALGAIFWVLCFAFVFFIGFIALVSIIGV